MAPTSRRPSRGSSCRPLAPRGEAEIKTRLRDFLAHRYAGEPETVIFEELGLLRRSSRADVAVVNGLLHGYEIKSDRDNLERLGHQVVVYGGVFDKVTIVVGTRHIDGIERLIPRWWEILEARGNHSGVVFKTHRSGSPNRSRSARALVQLLWLETSIRLLESRGAAKGFRSRPRSEVWDRLCEIYSLDEIAAEVRKALKARSAPGSAATRA